MVVDVRAHNRDAWDRQVATGNEWTIPVTPEDIAAARNGCWHITLGGKPVPREWFPPLGGASVLCLASGGGQQGPILAAAGAKVTVFDNSPQQLQQDRRVADREGLFIETVEGDMRDLSCFNASSFDLVVHPVSNAFVPDVTSIWREAYRVLRSGSCLLSGFINPVVYLFDDAAYERGELVVVHSLPYSDAEALSSEEIELRARSGTPLEFSHTLEELIGGQIEAGFIITGFYESRYSPETNDPLSRYTCVMMATRAQKSDETNAQHVYGLACQERGPIPWGGVAPPTRE